MAVKLDALIKKTEAAISAETDPKKRSALQTKLLAFASTRAEMDDCDDDDDDDEDSKSKKAAEHKQKMADAATKAAKKAAAAKHRAKAAEYKQKMAESEDAAKKAEAEEEEASAVATSPATEALTPGALAALASQADMAADALQRVSALEAKAEERERQATISKLLAERRILPQEAKRWAKKDAAFWSQVEEIRSKALVHISDDALLVPDGVADGDVPAHIKKMVEQAVTMSGLDGEKAEKFRQDSYAEHRKALAQQGSAGVTH